MKFRGPKALRDSLRGIPASEFAVNSSDVLDLDSIERDTTEAAWTGQPSGGGLPMITVMQAADAGHSHDLGGPPRPAFDHPESRRLLLQGIMNAIVVIILEVI